MEHLHITHNASDRRFEYSENGETAFIEYELQDGDIAFLHTIVPGSLSGRGVAAELTSYAFKYAKAHDLPVINRCPYIDVYLKKHPELNEQLDKKFIQTNKTMENYDSMIDAINALRKQGYTEDFNLNKDRIECRDGQYQLAHDEFSIDKSFRFDVDEDPSDQAVVYAISSHDQKLKGVLINGYGVYSDNVANELLDKLK